MFPRHVDVTAIIERWASGADANHGFALDLAGQDAAGAGLSPGTDRMLNVYGVRESAIGSRRPQLEIEYE